MAQPTPGPGLAVASLTTGAAALVLAAAARSLPHPTRRTVFAATPWMLGGGVLHALATSGAYDGPLAGVFGTLLAAPATVVLAGLLWLPLVQAGSVRGRADPAGYVAATGLGTVLLPTVAVALRGTVSPATVTSVLVVPVVAGLATVAVALALGLGGSTALAETRSLGLLAVYGQAFGGVSVAVTVDALGITPQGPLVSALVGGGAALGIGGIGTAWPVVLLSLTGSGLLVVGLSRLLDRYETGVYLALGAVAALGLGPGLARLLTAAIL